MNIFFALFIILNIGSGSMNLTKFDFKPPVKTVKKVTLDT